MVVIAEVRGANRKGAVLEALQKLRLVALHPEPQMTGSDEDFIAASARLRVCFDALDRIASSGERALIFLDSLNIQARLAGLIQRRYRLAAPPAIISGEVAGHRRQQRVDRFQAAPDGFDAMILSPRAGGVGLTLTLPTMSFTWHAGPVHRPCFAHRPITYGSRSHTDRCPGRRPAIV